MNTTTWWKTVRRGARYAASVVAMLCGPGLLRCDPDPGGSGVAHADVAAVAPANKPVAPANPKLVKLPFSFPAGMENTPVLYRGHPLLVQNRRSTKREEQEQADLCIGDLVTGQEIAKLGPGFSFVSAVVRHEEINVFATRNTNQEWTQDVYRFWSFGK